MSTSEVHATRAGTTVTLIGVVANAVLIGCKLAGGILGILASGAVCAARRLLRLPRLRVVTDGPGERAALRVGALVVLALGWIYLVLSDV